MLTFFGMKRKGQETYRSSHSEEIIEEESCNQEIYDKKHLKIMKRIFLCFCISIQGSSGVVHCTSSRAAVVQGDVYDTVQTQKI